jgi:hypothetical protein
VITVVRHARELEEMDVEGIPAAAAILSGRIRFDGKTLVGTGTTVPVLNYLNPIWDAMKELVEQTGANWNRLASWRQVVDALRRAA